MPPVQSISNLKSAINNSSRSPAARAAIALVIVIAIGFIFNADGAFLKWDTHRDMLRQVSVIGMLACGMTIVVISAGIDLAVGSVLGLCAVVFSLATMHWGWSAWQAALFTIAVGTACGAASGTAVAAGRIQPFIVTLAMMVFARGVAKWISHGEKISNVIALPDGSFQSVDPPQIFDMLGARVWGDNVSVVTIMLIASVVVCALFLTRFRWGRYMHAIGGNEEAARLAAVPVAGMKILAYSLCGLFAAVAGMCQAAQEMQGDPEAGAGYELSAIAMVVIGGTSLRGGRGSIVLTLLGILIIGYLEKILSINAVGEETRLMLTGVIIVAAVVVQRRGH
jgi:ribose transport system permease protein